MSRGLRIPALRTGTPGIGLKGEMVGREDMKEGQENEVPVPQGRDLEKRGEGGRQDGLARASEGRSEDLGDKLEGNGPGWVCAKGSTGTSGVTPTAQPQTWRNMSGALSPAKALGAGELRLESRDWSDLTPGGDAHLDGPRPTQVLTQTVDWCLGTLGLDKHPNTDKGFLYLKVSNCTAV